MVMKEDKVNITRNRDMKLNDFLKNIFEAKLIKRDSEATIRPLRNNKKKKRPILAGMVTFISREKLSNRKILMERTRRTIFIFLFTILRQEFMKKSFCSRF